MSKSSDILIALFLFCGSAIASSAELVPPGIEASLKQFRVQRYTLNEGVLRVVMTDRMVTTDVFATVAQFGVCSEQWREPTSFARMKLMRIEVLNSIDAQGFGLDSSGELCAQIGKLPQSAGKALIESRTIRCEAGTCRRRD